MNLLAAFNQQIKAATADAEGALDDFWYNPLGAESSDSGVRLTAQTAMRMGTVWKCVSWRGEQFGKLSKKIYQRVEQFGAPGRIEAVDHRMFDVVHRRPNPTTTSMAFFEQMSMDLDQEGNSYSYIQRDGFGHPIALWRLLPDTVHMHIVVRAVVDASMANGIRNELTYRAFDMYGNAYTFYADEILHVRGLGFDGIRGYSPTHMLMNTLGYARATVRYGAQFFKNSSRFSGIISVASAMKPDAKKQLIADLSARGRDSGALGLLEGAATFQKFSMDQDEAQFLETMQYQDEYLAGCYKVKPHKIGIMRHMTNNNVEQQNIEAATDSIHPLCERIEQYFDLAIFSEDASTGPNGGESEFDAYYMECDINSMMRGDMKSRSDYYKTMWSMGAMSNNEIRRAENLPGYDGGDMRVMPVNFATIQQIADGSALKAGQTAAKTDNPDDKTPADKPTEKPNTDKTKAALLPIFADAVGRVANRKKPEDKARCVPTTFYSAFVAIAAAFEKPKNTDHIAAALTEMAVRAESWTADRVDEIAAEELDFVLKTFLMMGD